MQALARTGAQYFSKLLLIVKMACKQMVSGELCFSITSRDLKCAVKSASYSKTYVKKIIKASLLNILYHRLKVDESQFQQKHYETIPYVTFKAKATDKYIRKFHDWIYGFSDALNKGYIKDVHLFMLEDSVPIEKYKFNLKYTDDNQKTPVESSSLAEATKQFLKTLTLLADHPKLGEETQLQVEFSYYAHTPEDYEPPGFEPSADLLALKSAETEMKQSFFLGRLNTGYHTIKCSARGKLFSISRSATPAPSFIENKLTELEDEIPNEESEVFTMAEHDTNKAVVNGDEDNETEYFPANTEEKHDNDCIEVFRDGNSLVSEEANMINITLESGEDSVVLSTPQVDCLCLISFSSLDVDMIQCVKCNRRYHAPCHGYYDNTYVDEKKFICVRCDKPNTEDKFLSKMSAADFASIASTRLFLRLIDRQQKFPFNTMKLIPQKRADLILDRLKETGVVTEDDNGRIDINQSRLTHYVINFFIQRESQTLNTETHSEVTPMKKRRRLD